MSNILRLNIPGEWHSTRTIWSVAFSCARTARLTEDSRITKAPILSSYESWSARSALTASETLKTLAASKWRASAAQSVDFPVPGVPEIKILLTGFSFRDICAGGARVDPPLSVNF